MSKHKDAAQALLKMAGAGSVQEAYDQYIAPSFIHHNQFFKGDRQSLLTAMRDASTTSPNKSTEITHVYEHGDTVITHSRVAGGTQQHRRARSFTSFASQTIGSRSSGTWGSRSPRTRRTRMVLT
jgi:predicted SnoaL-like aldol condensation-catalyzing enzyme